MTRDKFLSVAAILGFKPGVRQTLEEAAKSANEVILSKTREQAEKSLKSIYNIFFDAIDTNNDGHISVEEYKIYFNAFCPGVPEQDVLASFNAIDVSKNDEISREEFLAGARDFMLGLEPTELSEVYLGPLLP